MQGATMSQFKALSHAKATRISQTLVAATMLITSLVVTISGALAANSVQGIDQEKGNCTTKTMKDFHKQKHTDEACYKETKRTKSERRDVDPPVEGEDKSARTDLPEQPCEEKVESCTKQYRMCDPGFCLPSGRYHWETEEGPLDGTCPNPTYTQSCGMAPGKFCDSGYVGMADQLLCLIPKKYRCTPITNGEFAMLCAASAECTSERMTDAQECMISQKACAAAKQADCANNAAECAEGNCDTCFDMMCNQYLINVANENAATPCASNAACKTYSQVIWMVQKMYKQVYIPMAILFLLPGAVLTQAKCMASSGMINSRDEDTQSPISGLMRSTIAIFLIPATQLTVSYCIDVGNSVTDAVSQEIKRQGGVESILDWAHQQTYHTNSKQNKNFIPNSTPDPNLPECGKISSMDEEGAKFETMTQLSTFMQQCYNGFNQVLSQGLMILNAFQTVMICYLFLLGPLAAAFFAWPSGVGKDLFRKVFANWLDGIVILTLWKFWWNICLLCMAIRLGTSVVNPTDQYEMFMYTAFMGILMFVPFNPFEFRPGEIVSHVLEKAQQQAGKAGSSQGSGSGPGGGSGTSGGSGPGGAGGPVGPRHD